MIILDRVCPYCKTSWRPKVFHRANLLVMRCRCGRTRQTWPLDELVARLDEAGRQYREKVKR